MPAAVRKATKEPTKAHCRQPNLVWRSNDRFGFMCRIAFSPHVGICGIVAAGSCGCWVGVGWVGFFSPVEEIRYAEAMIVAIVGMAVNIVCAFVLHDAHGNEVIDVRLICMCWLML